MTGSIENGESPRDTIFREVEEEIGITPQNSILNTTVFLTEKDYFAPLQKFYGLELFFVSYLRGDQNPINCEPLKQDALGWFDIDSLPQPFIPGVAFGLKSYFDNQNDAEFYMSNFKTNWEKTSVTYPLPDGIVEKMVSLPYLVKNLLHINCFLMDVPILMITSART